MKRLLLLLGVVFLVSGVANAAIIEPGVGELDLIVDYDSGSITIVANAANITTLEIKSALDNLEVNTAATPKLLAMITGNATDIYGEMSMGGTVANTTKVLDVTYNTTLDDRDLLFRYGPTGQSVVTGNVYYVPEPATMALLGLGGLFMIRRRRKVA